MNELEFLICYIGKTKSPKRQCSGLIHGFYNFLIQARIYSKSM